MHLRQWWQPVPHGPSGTMMDMRHVQRLVNSVLTTAAGPANMSLAEYCHKHFIVITVVLRNKNTNIRIEINAVEGACKYRPCCGSRRLLLSLKHTSMHNVNQIYFICWYCNYMALYKENCCQCEKLFLINH